MPYLPLSLALAVAGCAASTPPAPVVGHEVDCSVEPARGLIGRVATAEIQREALRLSRSGLLRVLHPGDGATADFQTGRLNMIVDGRNIIMELRCG